MVPFMCVNESPCWVTVTPLAASDAISRSSFCILFKSAMPSARLSFAISRGARRFVGMRSDRFARKRVSLAFNGDTDDTHRRTDLALRA